MARFKKYPKIKFEGMYSTDEGYISFPYNPYHGKEYENVSAKTEKEIRTYCGIKVETDVIYVKGEDSFEIECELVETKTLSDGTLVLQICTDWG